jgi:hypothetical protein
MRVHPGRDGKLPHCKRKFAVILLVAIVVQFYGFGCVPVADEAEDF